MSTTTWCDIGRHLASWPAIRFSDNFSWYPNSDPSFATHLMKGWASSPRGSHLKTWLLWGGIKAVQRSWVTTTAISLSSEECVTGNLHKNWQFWLPSHCLESRVSPFPSRLTSSPALLYFLCSGSCLEMATHLALVAAPRGSLTHLLPAWSFIPVYIWLRDKLRSTRHPP
jgi:hypothetical protein